jgi:hypothetical protein
VPSKKSMGYVFFVVGTTERQPFVHRTAVVISVGKEYSTYPHPCVSAWNANTPTKKNIYTQLWFVPSKNSPDKEEFFFILDILFNYITKLRLLMVGECIRHD